MSTPGAPSNIGDGLSRLSTAVDQQNQGVTGDQTSPWTRAANTPNAMLGVGQQYAQSVGQTATAWQSINAPAKPGGPSPTAGQVTARTIRAAQQTVGAVMDGLTLIKSALDVGFANLTAPIAALFPSLPAATILSPYIGTPHAHPTHPPSGPPPVPPTPMPSIGMVTLGVSTRVLINWMPAARVDDIGLAPTCCGLPVAWFKIETGSSNVFIGGVRAARLMDICKACPMISETPSASAGAVMSAIGKAANVASKVMEYGGIAAGALQVAADVSEAAVEDDAAMAAGKALDAATTAAQLAMDIAKMAVEATMWKDVPVIPPTGSIGAIVDPTHVNVLIGGFPMINIPDPVSALLNRLSRYKAASSHENEGCDEEGEPVNVVSGANLEESVDFPICVELDLSWHRYYDSSRRNVRGPLGWGWQNGFEAELRFDADGILYVQAGGSSVAFPALVKDGTEIARSGILLRRVNRATYQLRRVGGPLWEFSIAPGSDIGRLVRVFSKLGAVRFVYGKERRLTRIDRSAATSIGLEYNSEGLLVRMVELDERFAPRPFVIYQYDKNENLVGWVDAFGSRATLEYDDEHRLTRKGDRRGYSYHYSYDHLSRCIHTWGEDGMYDVRLTYLEGMRCTKATHADGGTWTYFYDENGTITRILDPYGSVRERKVDSNGRVISERDAAGNEYRIVYDRFGGVSGRRDPFGDTSDDLRDLRRRNYFELTAPKTAIEYEYGSIPPKPTESSESAGSEVAYDRLGRKIEERVGQDASRRWTYDGNGNVLDHLDGDGCARRFEYASWNLLHREIDGLGNATEYAYTKRELVTKVVDPGGTTSQYEYDLRDNIVRVTRNGRVREEYKRDATDNLIEKRSGSGQTLLKFEIGPGNLKSVRNLASGENHYFEYDQLARITRAATDEHETLFEYRFDRRPISDLRNGRGVRHESEGVGKSRILVLNRFEVRYTRIGDELIITDPSGGKHRLRSRGDGKINLELSNGTSEISYYDSPGRYLSKARWWPGKRRSWVRTYSYSNEGDLLAVDDNIFGNVRYGYDAAHRLIGESGSDGIRNKFCYDAAGNLLEKPALRQAVIGEGNKLNSAGGMRFSYNDRDHIACFQDENRLIQFDYDSCDRLVRCTTPGGEWLSVYDPLGRRIRKSWKTSITEYFWDHNRLAAELEANGRLRVYVYTDASAIVPFMFVDYDADTAPAESGRRYFVATNQIGTPIQIEDDQAEPVWRARIDPYGVTDIQPANKIEFSLRFPGHQEDSEIGLFYNRFRYYSPALGRYLQSDPIGIAGGRNLYAYPANPLTSVDIFGLHSSKTTGPEDPDEEKVRKVRPLTPEEEVLAKKLADATQARAKQILNDPELRRGKGPVVTGVVDPRYPEDGPFFGQNTGVPSDISEPMQKRITRVQQELADGTLTENKKAGDAGTHSEINALNQALVNRGNREGRTPTDADINDMIGHNVNLVTNKVRNADGTRTTFPAGEGNPYRCDYCKPLTHGMRMVDQNGHLNE